MLCKEGEGLYTDSDSIAIETKAPVNAIRQNGRVEIWDEDCNTHLGNLPDTATAADVEMAYRFYQEGYKDGVGFGRARLQSEISSLLGIK